jgi:hypothetical protein
MPDILLWGPRTIPPLSARVFCAVPHPSDRYTWTLPTLRVNSLFWHSYNQLRAYIRPCGGVDVLHAGP